jgi:hypothetical protein
MLRLDLFCRGNPPDVRELIHVHRIIHFGDLASETRRTQARPAPLWGHFRQRDTLPPLTGCPLCSKSRQANACLGMSA